MTLSSSQLSDFFNFNLGADLKFLHALKNLPDKEESLKLLSHLVNAQRKWLNRIEPKESDESMDYFLPEYSLEELEKIITETHSAWIVFLKDKTEADLDKYVLFSRPDKQQIRVKIKDVAFQLNCHAIHHRAQIAKLIRAQGANPPNADYIMTALEIA